MRPIFTGAVVLALLGGFAAPTRAQSDFSGLTLQPGDEVYVVQPSGVEVFGPVTDLSATRLAINGRTFAPEPGMKIERRGDSLKNGFLIGAGIGAALGATLAAEACLHDPLWHCVIGGAIGYGAFGALLDWVHVGRTTIYQVTATPLVRSYWVVPTIAPRRKAVALALAF